MVVDVVLGSSFDMGLERERQRDGLRSVVVVVKWWSVKWWVGVDCWLGCSGLMCPLVTDWW